MKVLISVLLLTTVPIYGSDIYEYHKDFHFLLKKGEALQQISNSIDSLTPVLNDEVDVFAAADTRMSAELLFYTTNLLLHQHAALVDVYSKTGYFKESHIQPSIAILLTNSQKTRTKCNRYVDVVRQPELFQHILDLREIADQIETKLSKYGPNPKKLPGQPAKDVEIESKPNKPSSS